VPANRRQVAPELKLSNGDIFQLVSVSHRLTVPEVLCFYFWGRQWAYGVGRAMPDYRIFVLKNGRIKEPAKIISCPDDEAATEQARQLLDGTDQTLEVWQSDRRVTLIGPSNKGAKALPIRS
jgi:hypothetical protein